MAMLAHVESLAAALAQGANGPHVWLDPKLGLVTGTFPTPHARFDFAAEKLVEAGNKSTKRMISLLGEAKRVGHIYEIETEAAIFRVGSATQALIHGLNIIEEQRPGTLEELSSRKKQSKRPVARNRTDLYDVPHPASHSEKLKNGYYVATNNKSAEVLGYLREAAEIAGFVWGVSFIVRRA